MIDRALYTDDDVVVLEFRRVLALTTIDAGSLAGDLAERLLTIELSLIPDSKRREEAEFDAAFADAHTAILASLFDLLSRVLKALPDVTLTERPRMADFARILAGVDAVMGWDTFASYKAGARDAVADVLDGEPFAQALIALVDSAGPDGVLLTAQQVLDQVPTPDKLPKKWPKDATRAGGQIKRLAPALRAIGIDVDDSKRGPKPKKQRLYQLTARADRKVESQRDEGRQREGVKQRPQRPPRGVIGDLASGNRGGASENLLASPLAQGGRWGDTSGRNSASPQRAASHQRKPRRNSRGDAGGRWHAVTLY